MKWLERIAVDQLTQCSALNETEMTVWVHNRLEAVDIAELFSNFDLLDEDSENADELIDMAHRLDGMMIASEREYFINGIRAIGKRLLIEYGDIIQTELKQLRDTIQKTNEEIRDLKKQFDVVSNILFD